MGNLAEVCTGLTVHTLLQSHRVIRSGACAILAYSSYKIWTLSGASVGRELGSVCEYVVLQVLVAEPASGLYSGHLHLHARIDGSSSDHRLAAGLVLARVLQ